MASIEIFSVFHGKRKFSYFYKACLDHVLPVTTKSDGLVYMYRMFERKQNIGNVNHLESDNEASSLEFSVVVTEDDNNNGSEEDTILHCVSENSLEHSVIKTDIC